VGLKRSKIFHDQGGGWKVGRPLWVGKGIGAEAALDFAAKSPWQENTYSHGHLL